MLKRTIAILLALLMMASLAACGSSKEPKAAPTEVSEPESSEVSFADRESVDVGMFQVAYPEGWYYNEDEVSKEDYWALISFYDAEDSDSAENKVNIRADKEDVLNFRKSLLDCGIDLQECAAGNVETQAIGGAEFLIASEKSMLFYRHEPIGITYSVAVYGDMKAENVKALIEGIQPNLEDGDNTDAPWPWEGEPFQPTLAPQMVGTFTVTPEVVPFEESRWVMDIMDHKFYQQGDKLFHLFQNTLITFEKKTRKKGRDVVR